MPLAGSTPGNHRGGGLDANPQSSSARSQLFTTLGIIHSRARTNKHDATDYQCSYSARAFVPFYAQRLSATSAMNAAQGIHKGIEQRHRAHLKGGRLAPRART